MKLLGSDWDTSGTRGRRKGKGEEEKTTKKLSELSETRQKSNIHTVT
jgi:hypothetical protein